ncbi:unnamed protein product [Closterium sp. NIES-54]
MSAAEAEPIAARSSAKEESEEEADERRGILGRDVTRLEAAFAVDSTVTSDNAGDTEELVRLREALRGFRMPAEWEPHDGCWMIWPERPDNWRDAAVPAQQAFAAVAACISRFEPVHMLVSRSQWRNARQQLPASVRVIEMSSNDAWARDICPTFVVKDVPGGSKRHVAAIDWTFNAWGGAEGGCYGDWSLDDLIPAKMAELIPACMRHRTSLVMEGGSLHVDGEGALITTEQCLLHRTRNPGLSRAAIENHLCALLGVSTVIWLPRGLQGDEDTDGHVDNLACFVAPAHVLLAWTDDPSHPQVPALTACSFVPSARSPPLPSQPLCPAVPPLEALFFSSPHLAFRAHPSSFHPAHIPLQYAFTLSSLALHFDFHFPYRIFLLLLLLLFRFLFVGQCNLHPICPALPSTKITQNATTMATQRRWQRNQQLEWQRQRQGQYPVCQAVHEVLCSARDAKNRPLRITPLPLPPALFYSHQDVQGLAQVPIPAAFLRHLKRRARAQTSTT